MKLAAFGLILCFAVIVLKAENQPLRNGGLKNAWKEKLERRNRMFTYRPPPPPSHSRREIFVEIDERTPARRVIIDRPDPEN